MVEPNARARVIRTTAYLLQKQGYHGTGLKEILELSDAPKGSLYFHFPGGKEQLAVEAIRDQAARVSRAIAKTLAVPQEPGDKVRAFVDRFAEILRRSNYVEGCPVATVTLEAAASSEQIRQVCAESYAEWKRLVRERLDNCGLEPERADSLATLILAAVEGALILSRASKTTEPFDRVAGELASLITDAIERRLG